MPDGQIEEYLRQHVEFVRTMRPLASGRYGSIEEFVIKNGFNFHIAPCSKKHRRGALPRACFRNAMQLASRHDLIYVEGFAAGIIPVLHAWCVRPGTINVIDPTWADDLGVEYYGVPIKFSYVVDSLTKSNQYSVLDNWRQSWPILTDQEGLWKYDYRPLEGDPGVVS